MSLAPVETIRQLEPVGLWTAFADLNAVPRPSKAEQAVIEHVRQFGERLGLPTDVDSVGNVLIRKPASAGRGGGTPVVLQSHLDMVHQKNIDCTFDFATQGIEMQLQDDWVSALGTTLGADNGIGVAAMMAILAGDYEHPPLECLFTIDEETGMTGAKGLEPGWLSGRILLNLDTEEDTELTIGCAGGVDVTVRGKYSSEQAPADWTRLRVKLSGLTGGHSGMDIHAGRANANKLMNRILWQLHGQFNARIGLLDGGGLRNAIPRESKAEIFVEAEVAKSVAAFLDKALAELREEYGFTDPHLKLDLEPVAGSNREILPPGLQTALLGLLYSCPNGIFRMSPEIGDLVQTSNNLARVLVENGELQIGCLTRSSVDSERDDLAESIIASMSLLNEGGRLSDFSVSKSGEYPGWKPSPSSRIVELMRELYQEQFGSSPHVAACHAGLECGIIGAHYPQMEMISFGPNIRGAHSPDEKVQVSSVQKFWKYLLATLSRI